MKKKCFFAFLLTCLFLIAAGTTSAYQVPSLKENGIEFFYVFGKDGKPGYGSDDNVLILFAAIPDTYQDNILIKIFDPNVGERYDEREGKWSTSTRFSIYGGKGAYSDSRSRVVRPVSGYDSGRLLYQKTFSDEQKYDDHWIFAGPFAPEQGERIGEYYMFKIIAEGLKGNDNNLFRYDISPDIAEVFSYNISIRLAPKKGKHMHFFPFIPKDLNRITVSTFDLDVDGGIASLVSDARDTYKVKGSYSGKYRHTDIVIKEADRLKNWLLRIVKGSQHEANTSIYMKDAQNTPLRIYFRPKGHVPQVVSEVVALDFKCNTFTFDARESYDVDNQNLSFLWDFGDGNTSTEPVVTHIYEKGGEYTVTLKVQDDSGLPCDTATTSTVISVNTAPVASFVAPDLACINTNITFDASLTEDETSENLSYYWDFGDSNKEEGKRIKHIYKRGGVYKVSLSVDDNEDTSCSKDIAQKTIHINTPPIADAGDDITICLKSFDDKYEVSFNGSKSKDPDNDSLLYNWDFGDEEKGNGEKVSHVYKKGGEYEVSLTVDDNLNSYCSTDADTLKLVLNKPPKASAGKDKNRKICLGNEITFDASSTLTEEGENLTYQWDLDDGNKAEGKNIKHIYAKGGKYNVKLTASDDKGMKCSKDTDTVTVIVNSKPFVSLKGPELVCVDDKVSFDASASRDPDGDSLKYYWNFGDGSVKEASSKVTHAYRKGGIYTVRVTADDERNFPCSNSSDAIKIKVNTPPVANAGNNLVCCVNAVNRFDASKSYDADGDDLTYKWDFGDGATAEGAKVTHVYTKPGKYEVKLIVNDNSGTKCNISTSGFTAIVNAPPVPVIKTEQKEIKR